MDRRPGLCTFGAWRIRIKAPASALQQERALRIVEMRTVVEIFLIWGLLYAVLGGTLTLAAGGTQVVLALPAGGFALGAVGHWLYWRRKEDRLRAHPPSFAGKAALWAGLARDVTRMWGPDGYLFMTVDSLVFVRRLDGEDRGEFVIRLDDITALKAGSGRLIVWQGEGARRVFRMHGCREWRKVIAMARSVRGGRGNGF